MRLDSEYFSKLQKFVPALLQDQLIKFFYRIRSPLYKGENVYCICCDSSFKKFLPPFDECPGCGSQARHRLMLSYLVNRSDLFIGNKKVLHFAPELCLEGIFKSHPALDYVSADLQLPRAVEKIDMTNIDHPDGTFNVILCSHVLEHIPDDTSAMRELYRVLSSDGWAILQVPIDPNRKETYEDFSITRPEERQKHFGRFDHCRLYGLDYKDRLESAGFTVVIDDYVKTFSNEKIQENGFEEDEYIYLCKKTQNSQFSTTCG